ncbi:hypothetical protein HFZ78_20330 [Priestia megaterium]|uniref:Uncharacterized protein n=1 Tax=Priestia megaterium TaxID=1404 RepID=A0A6H1P591_PRIMG|nr:hypothetical protein [Priestia megaterium]QIZ08760.1 hypothetical protein HFZ78_20330 [Priestia megaterium]
MLIILNMNVDYMGQIYFGKMYEKNRKFEFITVRRDSQEIRLCAKGTAVYVNSNLQTKKSERIPVHIKQELESIYMYSEELELE